MGSGRQAAVCCHEGNSSDVWKEFDWKTKARFFKKPFVISKFVANPAAKSYWRGCGMVGDHSHIFWDCLKMISLWMGIKSEIYNSGNEYIIHSKSVFVPFSS